MPACPTCLQPGARWRPALESVLCDACADLSYDPMPSFLDALEPRVCACGEPTGSVALDACGRCEGRERARRALWSLHAEATLSHSRAVADLYADGGAS